MAFAAFAFLLAILGVYSIVSYSLARATYSMGVRMALGARPASLRARMVVEGFLPVAQGLILGVAGAVLTGRVLETLVEGAKVLDVPKEATSLEALTEAVIMM